MTTPALPITAVYKSVQPICKPNQDASVWFAKINLDVITVTVYMLIFFYCHLTAFSTVTLVETVVHLWQCDKNNKSVVV